LEVKGIVFTLDSIIAFGIMTTVISLLIFFRVETSSPYLLAQQMHFASQDILTILYESKLEDVCNQTLLNDYISQGILEEEDLNKTSVSVIGALWAAGNMSEAANITESIVNGLLPFNIGYQLTINDENVYNTSGTGRPNVSDSTIGIASRRIASGYEKFQPVSGFVSRAWATKIKKNTTEVFTFSPEGAGSRGASVEIIKKFEVGADEIINSTLVVSLHRGPNEDDLEEVKINGVDVRYKLSMIHFDSGTTGTGVFQIADITDEIQSGNNTAFLKFKNPYYNAHVHPGMRIEVTYSSNKTLELPIVIKKRFYFDNIVSRKPPDDCVPWWLLPSFHCRSGIFVTQPFYIPQNSTIKNITVHIKAMNITRYNNNDIRIFFNDNLIYQTRAPSDNYLLDWTGNMTGYAIEGTNLVLVYLNQYDHDTFRGTRNMTLYSDFETDNSSYIDIEYELPPEKKFKYGFIDVGINEYFGGSTSNPKSFTIDFEDADLWETFLHPAQIFSLRVDVDVSDGGLTRVFSSPEDRAVPSSIFIDSSNFDTSAENLIEMEDKDWGSEFLPETSFEYFVLIPSQVGYGDVNETQEGAESDAVARLNETLGKYVSATDIQTDSFSVTNVPYMWGPANIKVMVWV
jgi:hypothetical protein